MSFRRMLLVCPAILVFTGAVALAGEGVRLITPVLGPAPAEQVADLHVIRLPYGSSAATTVVSLKTQFRRPDDGRTNMDPGHRIARAVESLRCRNAPSVLLIVGAAADETPAAVSAPMFIIRKPAPNAAPRVPGAPRPEVPGPSPLRPARDEDPRQIACR